MGLLAINNHTYSSQGFFSNLIIKGRLTYATQCLLNNSTWDCTVLLVYNICASLVAQSLSPPKPLPPPITWRHIYLDVLDDLCNEFLHEARVRRGRLLRL